MLSFHRSWDSLLCQPLLILPLTTTALLLSLTELSANETMFSSLKYSTFFWLSFAFALINAAFLNCDKCKRVSNLAYLNVHLPSHLTIYHISFILILKPTHGRSFFIPASTAVSRTVTSSSRRVFLDATTVTINTINIIHHPNYALKHVT